MSIFVDSSTRVIVQGITGKEGSFWTAHMCEMGTQVVAGVTPGKEGQQVGSVPVYNSVRDAVDAHAADAAMLFVPPRFAKDAVFEALDAGMKKSSALPMVFPSMNRSKYAPPPLRTMPALSAATAPGSYPRARPCSACFPTGSSACTSRAASAS